MLHEMNGVIKSRDEHWGGKVPGHGDYIRAWGEAGTVKVKTKTTPKINDKGSHCLMVGCSEKHSADAHVMHYPPTNAIYETRKIIWLHRHYFLPQPDSNLGVKVGESVALKNNNRHTNIDVDDAIIENNNVIENGDTEEDNDTNHDENRNANDETEENNNDQRTTVSPKRVRVVGENEEVRVTRSGRPTMANDRAEVGGASLTQAENNYYEKIGVGTNTSN